MKRRIVNVLLAACLTAGMTVGLLPAASLGAKAATDASATVNKNLTIKASEVNQLLTGDLELPTTVDGLDGSAIAYSVAEKDGEYVSIESAESKAILKIKKRPKSNESDYKFTLKATVTAGSEKIEKEFPLTIRAGLSGESYAGYVYVCFSVPKGKDYDVQQIHFFLSEDGLNWTALNGCHPIFETGSDYIDNIQSYGGNSVNYKVAEGTDIAKTTSGDASVLFPFEGRDQGVRDPYLIRGSRADGSDSNKVWLLATDLNTHSDHYDGNKTNNICGNWGLTSTVGVGSQKLFVWETEDWVNWERRYIDVGKEVNSAMAWAPEAIYNPVKDNYLVYWSARVDEDGASRDRLYCNETKDFKTFGPTKLYEAEPYYENYKPNGVGVNSGYGNIDTSQLWVSGKDANGADTPYGTLYRVVKDETNNHIELMSASSVLDPKYEGDANQAKYDATNAIGIKPFTLDGKTYSSKADLSDIPGDTNVIKRAEIVHNWFIDQSVGNHFKKISQKNIEQLTGAYEGATMFKFIDRDEWCVMIDFYGNMQTRYEPYVTTDLSKADSITKMPAGTYGRTDGDIGTHGGMIPITAAEYNAMIDAYNADQNITNYHKINYIPVDTRAYDDKVNELQTAIVASDYSAEMKAQMGKIKEQISAQKQKIEDAQKVEKANARSASETWTDAYAPMPKLMERADKLLANKQIKVPAMQADAVYMDSELTLCTKNTEGLKTSEQLQADASIDSETSKITYTSSAPSIAAVDKASGKVTAKKQGTANITATAPGGAKAVCKVTVMGVPNKLTLAKKPKSLKKGKTFELTVKIPKGTVCSEFTYKSSKPKVASIEDGEITAKKKGTTKITVTAKNNKKAKVSFNLKVK